MKLDRFVEKLARGSVIVLDPCEPSCTAERPSPHRSPRAGSGTGEQGCKIFASFGEITPDIPITGQRGGETQPVLNGIGRLDAPFQSEPQIAVFGGEFFNPLDLLGP